MRLQGFVFVSVEGSYAAVRTSCDHGPTRQVISWVTSVDDAEVFPHDNIARRKFKELEKAQSLQAVETRVVQFQMWVKPEPVPAAPVPPPLPDQFQRPAWERVDCDRRVFVDGVHAMRYFRDDEALPLGVVHSEVEYQYGREAYTNKFAGGGA